MGSVVQQQDYQRLEQTINDAEERWGTDFDDANTLNDWAAYIGIYTARATDIGNREDAETQYDALIKAAGLALTAAARVRSTNIAARHYD